MSQSRQELVRREVSSLSSLSTVTFKSGSTVPVCPCTHCLLFKPQAVNYLIVASSVMQTLWLPQSVGP